MVEFGVAGCFDVDVEGLTWFSGSLGGIRVGFVDGGVGYVCYVPLFTSGWVAAD